MHALFHQVFRSWERLYAWFDLLIVALYRHRLLLRWVSERGRKCPATIYVYNWELVWLLLLQLWLWLLVHLLLIRRWLTAVIIVVVALAVILLCGSSVLGVAAGRWVRGNGLQSGVCWVGDLNTGAVGARLIHVGNPCNACNVHHRASSILFEKSVAGIGKVLERQDCNEETPSNTQASIQGQLHTHGTDCMIQVSPINTYVCMIL